MITLRPASVSFPNLPVAVTTSIQAIGKRAFDIVLALLMLPLIFPPYTPRVKRLIALSSLRPIIVMMIGYML